MQYMKILVLAILILLPLYTKAGDYQLYITTEKTTKCEDKELKPYVESCAGATWRPLCQADVVSTDLVSYFEGKEPNVKFLVSAFSNGHVTFCTKKAREIISRTLKEIKNNGNNARGRHLDDFMAVNKL